MAAQITFADESDAAAIAAIYRPIVESTAISFEIVPPEPNEIARRIAETTREHPWLVCEVGGRVAGYAYATTHRVRSAYRWSVDTSVYVDASVRRGGVGRGLYGSLLGILAAQGYFNAYAGIALPNDASVGLHEAVGFRKIGVYERVGYKFGEWRDVGWWQLTLRAHEQSPAEPLDVSAVRALPEWNALLAHGERAVRDETIQTASNKVLR
jgi:L-amino acid N-acyltransferase YncA